MLEILKHDRHTLLYIDEVGLRAKLLQRTRGRAPRGQRANCHRSAYLRSSRGFTGIACIDITGFKALRLQEGAVDGDIFLDYVRDAVVRSAAVEASSQRV